MHGLSLQVHGVVQGVGFRPFVYGLARDLALVGWVRNTGSGVEIEVSGPDQSLDAFIARLNQEAPPLARIDRVEVTPTAGNGHPAFEIRSSESRRGGFQPVPPDVSVCPDCLSELFDPNDRRYRYPFINCTNCGPRFTIIRDLPYDRPATTMAKFALCPACAAEYADPLDRRFHAQPVACPDCGPQLQLQPTGEASEQALQRARELLAQGRIVAVKGLGGFHLACDATNLPAVRRLRERKRREGKPFAVMLPDLAAADQQCVLDQAARSLLTSQERPIVVLQRQPACTIVSEVAPGQPTLGVMLPYTPLHYLLLERAPDFPQALVMTSGNLSDEPIAIDNREAIQRLSSLADAFLIHDRAIHARCDDPVLQVYRRSADPAAAYPLRRGRGYAPYPIQVAWQMPPILAAGPELKNTFCLTRQRYAFLSQHIGDLSNYETLRAYQQAIAHFERLFRIQPELLAYDLHPDYLATRYALERAAAAGLPAVGVQHHHAHIAACLAENDQPADHPVIGVAFDGTGYGTDGTIWGGEILLADYREFRRTFSLKPVRLPGGELAIRHPWRQALAWLQLTGHAWDADLECVRAAPAEALPVLQWQLELGTNAPWTSSMGRLFDAVAALAGIRQSVSYEAQAAIELEAWVDPDVQGAYRFELSRGIIDPSPVIAGVLRDRAAGRSAPSIAARFHNGVARMVGEVCEAVGQATGVDTVALSGGVWQNLTLLRKTVSILEQAGFTVLLHRKVPPNDGGVSLGQAVVAFHRLQ